MLTRKRKQKKTSTLILNIGGQNGELWCKGGEERFVDDTIRQSVQFSTSCFWFSTLVSKHSTLKSIYDTLKKVGATNVKTISMGQGQKIGRIVAWTFFDY